MRDAIVDFLTLPMPVLWLLLLALVLWRWTRVSRALLLVAAALFLAVSLPASGKLLIRGLQGGAPPFDGKIEAGTSAILVPTGGTKDDGTGRWWPTLSSVRRVAAALRLQRRHGLPVILAGGSTQPAQPPEAATLAAHFGLQAPAVRLETTARNTSQTAEAVAAMLASEAHPRVILVTSATHVARMSAALRHHGIEVTAAPLAARGAEPWLAGDFVPSHRGLKVSRAAAREYMGLGWYLLTGRLDGQDLW